jgi:hypothetical protein
MNLNTVRPLVLTPCCSAPPFFHLFSERMSEVASTGDQTDGKETCGGGHTDVNLGKRRASEQAVEPISRRIGLEYDLY